MSTQWTAQFLVAAELSRQGYEVSFTMGSNTPVADLMVGSPTTGELFWVDVKGQKGKSGWIVRSKNPRRGLFYILTFCGTDRRKDRFFILSQRQAERLSKQHRIDHPKAKGLGGGFNFNAALKHEDKWDVLPR